jgi:hypothetical protein
MNSNQQAAFFSKQGIKDLYKTVITVFQWVKKKPHRA